MTDQSKARKSCRSCSARSLSDWSDLPAHCHETIDLVKKHRVLEEGQTLFRQGDNNAGLHCAAHGLFALRMSHENGAEVLIGIARTGETLGSRAFLRNGPHRTTAVALTRAEVCTIHRRDAVRLTQEAPTVYLQLVKRCLRAMDDAQEDKLRIAAMSNRARLCHLLLRLADCDPREPGPAVETRLPISRADLASMIGIQPESVSRLLRRLKDEGLVEFSGRWLRIPDPGALNAQAGLHATKVEQVTPGNLTNVIAAPGGTSSDGETYGPPSRIR